MPNPAVIAIVSFVVAFTFGLGGLGSAVALIPILVFLGVPFTIARATGLFVNLITTISITAYNLKSKNLSFGLAVPVVLTSIVFAPIGAYVSFIVPGKIVGFIFTAFLFFAGTITFIPRKRKAYRTDCSKFVPAAVGALAGFLSGLLGVGGGGIISPMLMLYGLNPKVVVTLTAFSVPFSSFASFLTYWKLGGVNWSLILASAVPAIFAGYTSGYVTHRYLSSSTVRKLLGVIFYILAIRFILMLI